MCCAVKGPFPELLEMPWSGLRLQAHSFVQATQRPFSPQFTTGGSTHARRPSVLSTATCLLYGMSGASASNSVPRSAAASAAAQALGPPRRMTRALPPAPSGKTLRVQDNAHMGRWRMAAYASHHAHPPRTFSRATPVAHQPPRVRQQRGLLPADERPQACAGEGGIDMLIQGEYIHRQGRHVRGGRPMSEASPGTAQEALRQQVAVACDARTAQKEGTGTPPPPAPPPRPPTRLAVRVHHGGRRVELQQPGLERRVQQEVGAQDLVGHACRGVARQV
jgi:hypothetical protein